MLSPPASKQAGKRYRGKERKIVERKEGALDLSVQPGCGDLEKVS